MGVLRDIEFRPASGLSPRERAKARDCYVRDFDRQFRDWSGIARCCIEVERDGDWELLGFTSFHSWLIDAAPASRSYLYLVMGRYKELVADIPEEELEKIPLGSAGVLVSMSKSSRRDPKVRQAAQKKPEQFVSELKEIAPEQHIESKIRQIVDFTASQWAVVEGAFEAYKLLDPNATLAIFIEWMVTEVKGWSLHVDDKE